MTIILRTPDTLSSVGDVTAARDAILAAGTDDATLTQLTAARDAILAAIAAHEDPEINVEVS